jgi:autotransporter adhesin
VRTVSRTAPAQTPRARGSIANGENATAIGTRSNANGINATALGQGSLANGDASTAIGQASIANATAATAIGQGSTAIRHQRANDSFFYTRST